MLASSCNCTFTWTTFFHTVWAVHCLAEKMKRIFLSFLLITLPGLARLEAHAFLKRAEPAVGGTVHTSPEAVRIWFPENIETAFSTIQVFDASGKEVDKRNV